MSSTDFRLTSLERVVLELQARTNALEHELATLRKHNHHANDAPSPSKHANHRLGAAARSPREPSAECQLPLPLPPRHSASEGQPQRPRTEERASRYAPLTESPGISRRRAQTPEYGSRSSEVRTSLTSLAPATLLPPPLKPINRNSSAASLTSERYEPPPTAACSSSVVRLRTALTSPGLMVPSGGQHEPPPPLLHSQLSEQPPQQMQQSPPRDVSNLRTSTATERMSMASGRYSAVAAPDSPSASEPAVVRRGSRSSATATRSSATGAIAPPAPPPNLTRIGLLEATAERPVQALVVTADGTGLVAAGLDGNLHLWCLSDAGIAGMAAAAGGESLGLGTTFRSAKCWTLFCSQPVGSGELNAAALIGTTLACGCEDGSIPLFRLQKEAGAFILYSLLRLQHKSSAAPSAALPPQVMCVALSQISGMRQSPLLVSGAQDGSVCTWNTRSGELLQCIEAHPPSGDEWVMSLVLDREADDGRDRNALCDGLLATASFDRTVKVWTHAAPVGSTQPASFGGSWVLKRTLEGHTDGVISLVLSKSRRVIFSGSNDETIRAWVLATGACLHEVKVGGGAVSALAWHLSSSLLVAGSEDGSVTLWDVSQLEAAAAAEAPPPRKSSPAKKLEWRGGSPGTATSVTSAVVMERVGSTSLTGSDAAPAEVVCLVASADGTALWCGLDDGSVALVGAESQRGQKDVWTSG